MQKKQVIRIKDIAEKASVSVGTVDRVLHNRGKVSEDVRKRILQILAECEYQPNYLARALVSKKQLRLAVLIPDPSVDAYWQAPKDGIQSAFKEVSQYGILLEEFIFNPQYHNSFINRAKALTESKPDGILLSPIFYKESLFFFKIWNDSLIPFVLFNTEIPEYNPLSYIGQDSYQSGKLVGRLIHYGEKQPCRLLIAHIGEEISNAAHLEKKEMGLRDYFDLNQELKRYEINSIQLNLLDLESECPRLNDILFSELQPSQIYVTTSRAYQIARYLEQKNLKHINIIGYDLLPENISYMSKGMITFLINQNPKGQGYWGIYELVNYLVFDKKLNKRKFLPIDVVTNENLSYYIDDDFYKNIVI